MSNVTSSPKVCSDCGNLYQPTSNRQKYCETCAHTRHKERCKSYHKRTYKEKGYDQAGDKNNAWKGGIFAGYYQSKAYAHYGRKCMECGAEKYLCVHHRNENRYNNELENLEVLCRSCHAKRHKLHKNFTSEKV